MPSSCARPSRRLCAMLALSSSVLAGCAGDPRCYPGEIKFSDLMETAQAFSDDARFQPTASVPLFMKKYNAAERKTDYKNPSRIGVIEIESYPIERWVFIGENDCVVYFFDNPRGTFKKFEGEAEGI